MAWDDENERISALAAGLGGVLTGMLPWSASGFQSQDTVVLVGTGIGTASGPTGGAAEGVSRFDWVSVYGARPKRLAARMR